MLLLPVMLLLLMLMMMMMLMRAGPLHVPRVPGRAAPPGAHQAGQVGGAHAAQCVWLQVGASARAQGVGHEKGRGARCMLLVVWDVPLSGSAVHLLHTSRAATARTFAMPPPRKHLTCACLCRPPCRYNKPLPRWLGLALAYSNFWVGQKLGFVLVDAVFNPENHAYARIDWPCDVSQARALLGWEPTPWVEVAARIGKELRSQKGAKAGKAKAE